MACAGLSVTLWHRGLPHGVTATPEDTCTRVELGEAQREPSGTASAFARRFGKGRCAAFEEGNPCGVAPRMGREFRNGAQSL